MEGWEGDLLGSGRDESIGYLENALRKKHKLVSKTTMESEPGFSHNRTGIFTRGNKTTEENLWSGVCARGKESDH